MPSPYWSSRYLTNNVRIISLSMLKSPSTEQIKITRKTLGFTQKESAEMVHCSLRAWQLWEAGDRTMPAGVLGVCMAIPLLVIDGKNVRHPPWLQAPARSALA